MCLPFYFVKLHKTNSTGSQYYRSIVFALYDLINAKYLHRHKQAEVTAWHEQNNFTNLLSPELGSYFAEKNV